MNKKIKIFLTILLIQSICASIFYLGFLLDPLCGIIVLGLYFFVVASFFMAKYFSYKWVSGK